MCDWLPILDIGGFFVKKKPELWFWCGKYEQGVDDLDYGELDVRWFQYDGFLLMFRAHGMDMPREIWRFGNPGEESVYDALAKYLHPRYRLMPYIYALASQVTYNLHDVARTAFRFSPWLKCMRY